MTSTSTEDFLVAADQRSLNLPPLSLFPNDEQSVGSLLQFDFHTHSGCSYSSEDNINMVDKDAYPSEDDANTVDDPTLTARPKIVCAISELREQQPSTTTLTSAEFNVLDDLTKDLLVAAVKRSLNVPPLSLCPNDGQSSSISRRDNSSTSSENVVPWIMVPRVLDKLLEFDEVSSEIKNADPKYGKHLPPLPSCLASAPEIEHIPPTTRHPEDNDCMAPDRLNNNVPLLTTMDNQQPSDGNCVPDVQIERPILSEVFRTCEKQRSDITAEDSKSFLEQLSPVTHHVVEETQLQSCASSAIEEISTPKVKSAVTEQLNVHMTPARIQLSDAPIDDDDLVPSEGAESTVSGIVSMAVAKSDDDGLNPGTTTVQVKSAATEKPRPGRRVSFLTALGRRFLKFGRTLCCCCCTK